MTFKVGVALVVSLVVSAGVPGVARAAGQEAKAQVVKLTVGDSGGYVVSPPTVTKGVPVKMEVDLRTVKGCARTVVIAAFGVKKTVKQDDTTILFTPGRTGTIDVICGMNMVKGSFTVVDR